MLLWLAGALTPVASAKAEVAVAEAFVPSTKNLLDGGLVLALPAALQTGTSAGVVAGFLRTTGSRSWLGWGARASWSTATEYTTTESVRNDDLRLRLCALAQRSAGRGSFGLRLGLGATLVYEGRTRAQGNRAGLSGSDLESAAWYALPAADLEGVVLLRVWHSLGMSLAVGPTLHLVDGNARWGWSSSLGILWQP